MPALQPYLPPLALWVIWHPDFSQGASLANALYSAFTRDVEQPVLRGIGIPIFFRAALSASHAAPDMVDLGMAKHSAVILLVDDVMVADDDWNDYVEAIASGIS